MTTETAGLLLAMATPADGSVSPLVQLLPFAFVLGIFYFIILLPMKRRQKKVAQFLETLKVNDRVITTGGIYGVITKVSERSVQLQIADKVRIEVSKAAIGGYQGQEPVVTDNNPQ
ncbi:MAG: preprotein translocase subunit YajC [Bacteroidales bacterium]